VERIKQVQPHINAMAQDCFDSALEEAAKVDELLARFRETPGKSVNEGGDLNSESSFSSDQLEKLNSPLLGVPVSIKESIAVKGMRHSCGVWARKDTLAQEDAVTVRNVKRLGMIPICTTNIPECTLFWADCQNAVYGRTLNPYDLSRISGASSGGEGSLLGSGGSLIGVGSDIGGSLRIPAHYCGVYSHKPSPFLVSAEGNFPPVKEARLRMFTIGPMCRYASDLRHLLKCLLSDKDNAKQDTYFKYQPENIGQLRKEIIDKLDEPVDLSQIKLFYFNFNSESQLKGKQSVHVQEEIMEAQQEVLDHFVSKYSCAIEHINLDKYFKRALITWQCMLRCGGVIDRDESYEEDELNKMFGIKSALAELIKIPLGLSKHTKESLLTIFMNSSVPRSREEAFALCEKFEKLASELKSEITETLGSNGVLLMPTLPTVAYKHHVALMKTPAIRFPSLFNLLQLPVTHATVRLDKKHRLPFGLSIAAKPYNDPLSIAIAEEIESAFGGWTQPTFINAVSDNKNSIEVKESNSSSSKAVSAN